MDLPQNVQFCIRQLEGSGFACYAVGGCVRDALLGLTPQDYDLCTAATPEQICLIFDGFPLVRAGEKHGTIGVVMDGSVIEITTFRTEDTYSDNRHPDRVCFVDSVEADLSRRDFTVNAMAFSPTRGLCDPFGGRTDLQKKILRAVGDPARRFREDALRILRGVRFSVRYGLTPEPATADAMVRLAPLMEHLARERVFEELCKLLPLVNEADLCRFAPILTQPMPELARLLGFDQHSRHHAHDAYTHTAQVVAAVPAELTLRWAALLHDVGKPDTFSLDDQGEGHFYGHAAAGAALAGSILRRLKAPARLTGDVVLLIDRHMTKIEPEKKTVRRWLSRLGAPMLEALLTLQAADMGGKGMGRPEELAQFSQIRSLMDQIQAENACLSVKDLQVNGHDLMALGLTGPAIGAALNSLLEQVLDETLPNEKQALLNALQEW